MGIVIEIKINLIIFFVSNCVKKYHSNLDVVLWYLNIFYC